MKWILNIFVILSISCSMNRPSIECFNPNNDSADTSYYVLNKSYQGFIFPANYDPMLSVGNNRFTPDIEQIQQAELILSKGPDHFNSKFKRQYLGSVNSNLDSLITIRLVKKGFNEECFDKIVAIGFGQHYEKNQIIKIINLKMNKIE